VWAIADERKRRAYLGRHYHDWSGMFEMNIDHRSNHYFENEITCSLSAEDDGYRPRSKRPTTLKKPLFHPSNHVNGESPSSIVVR
jgi:hypothetical protein